jgi:hypothetical protein
MELFLNILWLVIAVAGLCVWRICWAHQQRAREHSPWRQWTAFGSALVLLFFMVSLTDDLHSELIYFEECAANRRHTSCLACPHHAPPERVTSTHYAIRMIPSFSQQLSAISSIIPSKEFSPVFPRLGAASGRAPPVMVL